MSHVFDTGPVKWDLEAYRQHIPYLGRYLSTLLSSIGRSERRVATARYLEGLLLPGRRKFIRPLAERLKVDSQSMQQAVAHSPWDDQKVWSSIRRQVIPLLEPFYLAILHERAWVRQGDSTVGVGNQRCGANGKKSHCQVSVEVLLSDGATAAPAAGRLFLPEDWADDKNRRESAEVPDHIDFCTRPALAVDLLKEIGRDGLSPGTVLADSSYGNDPDFRAALIHMGIEFFLEVDSTVNMAWDFNAPLPVATIDPRHGPFSLEEIVSSLHVSEWKNCAWMTSDGVLRRTRFAIREVFLDSNYRVQGELQKLWFVVDWPVDRSRPYRCYLGHFHRRPNEIKCLRLSRQRGYLDHYQRCFDGDLDLTCYQGRSWKGFHHHLVLSAAAYLFVLMVELRKRRGFWPQLSDDLPVDPVLSAETARLVSVLFRSGNISNVTTAANDREEVEGCSSVNGYLVSEAGVGPGNV